MVTRKENLRLGQKVRWGLFMGIIDALTQSTAALKLDDGRYVLASYEEIAVA